MTESQFIHLESARDQLNSTCRVGIVFLPERKTVVMSKAGGLNDRYGG